jgi:hypothetical protein
MLLSLAYDILNTRHPGWSPNDLYFDLAEHYGCSWDTVRKAREFVRERRARRRAGDQTTELATLDLPRLPGGMDGYRWT